MELKITHDQNWQKLTTHFKNIDAISKVALQVAIQDASFHTLQTVKSSGRVPRKTSTLFRDIRAVQHINDMNRMYAEIGTNLPYAAIHEYGGTFTRTSAWGRPTRPYSVTYKERKYLRGGLQDSTREIHNIFNRSLRAITDIR